MKKVIFILILIMCILVGCGRKAEKMCRIDIYNNDGTGIITLEQQSQSDIVAFFDEDNWKMYDYKFDEKLTPEYIIELYQEKTKSLIQSEKQDTYEKIMEYTIYNDSDIVKVVISEDIIKDNFISDEVLTFYYIGSEKFFLSLNNVIK